ncbi:YihY/virulence factor BrkB family protein [Paraflavitalea pollutisoli]|uniref:YihY/virulence factor BrkB family protein n=1 Tax=Paraflavitalea pollutisoli TaxID=3034143 RepID=UPI0023ED02A8|nr:YihY/virulence factor BrkB family protein [Paraflavitalea sp. H1-2-19X]
MPSYKGAITLAGLMRAAFREFQKNDPLRIAAATAFFTTFALPAIVIILIQIFGLIAGRRAIGQQLFTGLTDILGPNAVEEMRATLRNVRQLAQAWYIAAGVFLFLIFVSTTLFKVIRDTLNQLWDIRLKDSTGFLFQLRQRGRSFLIILLAGMLFLTVLLAEGLLTLLPEKADLLNRLLKQIISVIAATAWFTLVFKYISDGYTNWRTTLAGAFFTGLLFTIGKMILGVLLSYSTIKNIYATSTSFVLLLLFVFYCSFMFYYGACFLKVWASHKQHPITPHRHAIRYKLSMVD